MPLEILAATLSLLAALNSQKKNSSVGVIFDQRNRWEDSNDILDNINFANADYLDYNFDPNQADWENVIYDEPIVPNIIPDDPNGGWQPTPSTPDGGQYMPEDKFDMDRPQKKNNNAALLIAALTTALAFS